MKIEKPVIIEDYNDDWPFIFNELKEILEMKLGDLALTIRVDITDITPLHT